MVPRMSRARAQAGPSATPRPGWSRRKEGEWGGQEGEGRGRPGAQQNPNLVLLSEILRPTLPPHCNARLRVRTCNLEFLEKWKA